MTHNQWVAIGKKYEYTAPKPAHWFYRSWGVRWLRFAKHSLTIETHYELWRGVGVRTGFDDWVLCGIYYGWL